MINLKEKVTLVTGGSRGIGRAACLLFAAAGSDVIINYRRDSRSAADVRREAEKLGVTRYVKKPYTMQKLGKAIREVLATTPAQGSNIPTS